MPIASGALPFFILLTACFYIMTTQVLFINSVERKNSFSGDFVFGFLKMPQLLSLKRKAKNGNLKKIIRFK